jgi:hypothetical protein
MQDNDRGDILSCISWLADSPLFIDEQQIGAFYDAVVGPAFRTVQLQLATSKDQQKETSFGARLGAKLKPLFPWVEVDAEAETRRATTRTEREGQTVVLEPVHSAARQLVELSLHYMVNQQDRFCFVGRGTRFPSPAPSARVPGCSHSLTLRLEPCSSRKQPSSITAGS